MKQLFQNSLEILDDKKPGDKKKTSPPIYSEPLNQFRHRLTLIEGLLILVPVLLFFNFVYTYAINVPYMDDMDLVYVINDIQEKPEETLQILVRQQNDHRIFFSRLGMIVVYLFTGEINFRYATLLGFANLLLLAYAFYLIYRKYHQDLIGFLPIAVLLFSPLVYFVHLSSLPAYQHSLSVAFSILSLYFLQRDKQKHWYWSLPLAFASTLTILDGLSTIPIGLTWLLIQRRFRESLLFGFFSALWLAVYFSDFYFSSSSKLIFSFDSLLTMLYGFVAFTGSIARLLSDTYSLTLSFALGVIILLTSLSLIFYHMSDKTRSFRLSRLSLARLELVDLCFLRMLASGAMIAIGRTALGIEVVTAVRFQVFSLSIVILFYLLLIRVMSAHYRKPFLILSLAISIAGNAYAYNKYDHEARELVEELKADTYNYTHNQVFLHQYFNLPDPPVKFYRNYSFPKFFESGQITSWLKGSIRPRGTNIKVESKEIGKVGHYGDYIHNVLELKIQNVPAMVPDKDVYLALQSTRDASRKYLISVSESSASLFQPLAPDSSRSFHGLISLKIPEEKYKMQICWIEGTTPRSILIPSYLSL